jgi:glycosyltransferase involved in cell wall biosynthesis
VDHERRSVLVVAPYCPAERGSGTALGAAAKLRAVMAGFIGNGWLPRLVNSGHQQTGWRRARWQPLRVADHLVAEHLPRAFASRPLGKLLQALQAPWLGWRLQRRCAPTLVWLYNSYLFEALFAVGARWADPNVLLCLELEDLPLARGRRGTGRLKTWLDAWAFRLLAVRVDVVTVVQPGMQAALPRKIPCSCFLPVLLADQPDHMQQASHSGREDQFLLVGYFGGLTAEKGADLLIEVIRRSPAGCRWLVSGVGQLASAFCKLAADLPDRIAYLGVLGEDDFRRAYDSADAVVNLHRPMADFRHGIFPYKLLEAVGAGKSVISTRMEGCPAEVANVVHWLGDDPVGEGVAALERLLREPSEPDAARLRARDWVRNTYSATPAIGRIIASLPPTGISR